MVRRSRGHGVDERGSRGAAEYLRLCGFLLALNLLTTAAFFGYVRQGALLLPLLFGCEGITVAVLARGFVARLPRGWPRARLLLFCLLALGAIEAAGAFQSRNFIASGETMAGSSQLNRDSILHLRPAAAEPSTGRPGSAAPPVR